MSNIEKYINKYPKLFQGQEPISGYEIGPGWNVIMENLMELLENEISRLPADEQPDYYLCQVKEKFGKLRVYLSQSTQFMDGAIEFAETISSYTCEKCGGSGSLRKGPWIRTLCDNCYKD